MGMGYIKVGCGCGGDGKYGWMGYGLGLFINYGWVGKYGVVGNIYGVGENIGNMGIGEI